MPDPGERSDEQLMLGFCAGEAGAFEVLLRRHRTAVFNFILRFTGDRQKAEDLLQETWIKVIRSAPQYETRAKFTTWVFTIARNLCVDLKRREVFRRTESLDQPASDDDDRPGIEPTAEDAAADPERAAHAARLRPAVEQALASLPEEQREVFMMRELGGMPFKEIAEATGVPENTVKSRMRYALEGLRKALRAQGIDGDMAADAAPARAVAGA